MPRERSAPRDDLAELEDWLASGLVPVEADDAFVETVHRRLAVQDPRPMEIAWHPPTARQYILFTLAAVGGSLLTLGLAVLLWLYRRSVARSQA
ncbi:MAG: hypothetical protein GXO37_01085 [Chloroflexi bacterium]|nr:hypothetical protein [Chloroflexota bacterium]